MDASWRSSFAIRRYYWPVAPPLTMSTDGGEVEPWIFFGAMALMAIVATGTYMAEQDAVNSTLHRS